MMCSLPPPHGPRTQSLCPSSQGAACERRRLKAARGCGAVARRAEACAEPGRVCRACLFIFLMFLNSS